jgi:hypothetical protein
MSKISGKCNFNLSSAWSFGAYLLQIIKSYLLIIKQLPKAKLQTPQGHLCNLDLPHPMHPALLPDSGKFRKKAQI